MAIKPTKVTKEDLELADEISRVTAIKELVASYLEELVMEFQTLESISETANPVATYKAVLSSRDALLESAHILQAQLLPVLGEIDGEDAMELSDPNKQETAGTMDAAFTESDTKIEEN